MSDGWTCSICEKRLSTNSNSAYSVAFDLEIQSHVTAHECTCESEAVCNRCSLRKNLW